MSALTLLSRLRSFLRIVFRRARVEREMDAELLFHIEQRTRHLIDSGMEPAAATQRARDEFGDVRRWKEAGREARGAGWIDGLRGDGRQALRQFRRSPGFAAAVVVSMAIAIGANTAIFSLVNAVVIKRLAVHDPQSLILFGVASDPLGSSFPYPFYRQLHESDDVLAGIVASASMSSSLEIDGATERVRGELVSGNYFSVLGVKPHLGRLITDADDRSGAHVVVIGYGFWQRRFGGDPGIVGRTIVVNRQAMTIVGVRPADFHGIEIGGNPQLHVPISLQPLMHGRESILENPEYWWLQMMGRVKQGVSRAQAADVLERHYQDFRRARLKPGEWPERLQIFDGSQGRPTLRWHFEQPLMILTWLVAVVLLIVCVNVGNLMLARGTTRQREMAVRLALGAGRRRIARQLLIEVLSLAAAAGVIGVWLAIWGARTIAALSGAPAEFAIPIDVPVLGFAVAITLVTTLLSGLAPTWLSSRENLVTGLKIDTAQVTGGRLTGRRLLVAGQIAMALALVVGAGLFVRTLFNLRHADFGFSADRVALVTMNPILAGYSKDRVRPFYRDVLERVSALPSVESASYAIMPLLAGDLWGSGLTLDTGEKDDQPGPTRNVVGPEFFRTVGLTVREGREFAATDDQGGERVAIVNETFARRYFQGRALGRRIGPGGPAGTARYTIVGIINDSKIAEVREPARAFWYIPLAQFTNIEQLTLHVRSIPGRTAADAMAEVKSVVASVDKSVPIMEASTIAQQIEDQISVERLMTVLAGTFAGLAVVLAWIGLHGVMSYLASARAREVSLRMALGASPRDIVRLIFGQSAFAIVGGVVAGAGLAWIASQPLQSLLYGLEATDVATLVTAIAVVVVATTVAAMLPARRASKGCPANLLR